MRVMPAAFFAVILCGFWASHAMADGDGVRAEASGKLPASGRIVIRSGLAWLNESSPSFRPLARELDRCLREKKLTVVTVKPAAMLSMPRTPRPPQGPSSLPAAKGGDVERKASRGMIPGPPPGGGVSDEAAREKAAALAQSGKLPQVALRGYATPERDSDLPGTVLATTAPDARAGLYAISQRRGTPVTRGYAIPGRLPPELASDAKIADYALIARFAQVYLQSSLLRRAKDGFGAGNFLVAAGGVGGVGSLGFGAPARPSASQPNTYGSPEGFRRGYEGSAPGDFWHRDHDFFQRDYQFKYGEPPAFASPPPGAASTLGRQGSGPVTPRPADAYAMFATVHLLLLDCYDLAPVRKGGEPALVWRGSAFMPGGVKPLVGVLPALARAIFDDDTPRN